MPKTVAAGHASCTKPRTSVEGSRRYLQISMRRPNRQEGTVLLQPGIIGLGRMGAKMARRLLAGGHRCVVFDRSPKPGGSR
jgi:phosphoglycerate dehydrogenase-like enzyme